MSFRHSQFFVLFVFAGAVAFGFWALPVSTQAATAASIAVDVIPSNPAPGENVTINLSSFANNLDSVLISWSIDGKKVASEIGKKSISLNAPEAGKESSVSATLSLPGDPVTVRILIRPTVMTLLWQADDSYVPPFYKGKALPSIGSAIKVVAFPEIKSGAKVADAKTLVYAWRKDYLNDQTKSGYGKNYYTYVHDFLENSNNITVSASTSDQKFSATKSLDVRAYPSKILFYEANPELGTLWERALSSGYRVSGETIIEAAPYFVSPADIRIPTLVFKWFINNELLPTTNFRKNFLPVQTRAGVSGTSRIKLEVENTSKLLESTTKEIRVTF